MEMKELFSKYMDFERRLIRGLEELESFGSECKCKNREIMRIIHEGEFLEIMSYCINCGGYTE